MNKLKLFNIYFLLFFTPIIGACSVSKTINVETINTNDLSITSLIDTSLYVDLSKTYQNVSYKTFKLIYENISDKQENIFISPLSIEYILGMLLNGATNATKDSIMNFLEIDSVIEFNSYLYNLYKSIPSSNDFSLKIANSIWIRQELEPINKAFFDLMVNYYFAHFDIITDASTINDWVREETENKIDSIITDNDLESIDLLLINAIYYKANWNRPFDPNYTRKDYFFLENGDTLRCYFMNNKNNFLYKENNFSYIMALKYKGVDAYMYVILPKENYKVGDIIPYLSDTLFYDLKSTYINLYFPKFSFYFDKDLSEDFKNSILNIVFDKNKASFGNFTESDYNFYVNKIKHKSYIKVGEEGTEAAAVTSAELILTSTPINEDYITLKLNKPFIFIIKYKKTNLFIGILNKPK